MQEHQANLSMLLDTNHDPQGVLVDDVHRTRHRMNTRVDDVR